MRATRFKNGYCLSLKFAGVDDPMIPYRAPSTDPI